MGDPKIREVDFRAQCQAVKFVYDLFGFPERSVVVEEVCTKANPEWKDTGSPAAAYFKDDKLFVQKYTVVKGQAYPQKSEWIKDITGSSQLAMRTIPLPNLWHGQVDEVFESMFGKKADAFARGALALYSCLTTGGSIEICQNDMSVQLSLLSALDEEFKSYYELLSDKGRFDKDQYDILEWQIKKEPAGLSRNEKLMEIGKTKLTKVLELYYAEQLDKVNLSNSQLLKEIESAEPFATSACSDEMSACLNQSADSIEQFKGTELARIEKKYLDLFNCGEVGKRFLLYYAKHGGCGRFDYEKRDEKKRDDELDGGWGRGQFK